MSLMPDAMMNCKQLVMYICTSVSSRPQPNVSINYRVTQ